MKSARAELGTFDAALTDRRIFIEVPTARRKIISLIKGQHEPEPTPISGRGSLPDQKQWPQISQTSPGRVSHDKTAGPDETPPKRRLMGHQLMMMVWCIPMLVVVGVLILTGVLGSGAIVYALVCAAMMAAMMFLMPGRKQH